MDWKKLVLAYFYGDIRGFAQNFIGSMFGIPVDLVLLAVGYWKSNTWWGETLAISAATVFGMQSGGLMGLGLFKPQAVQSQKNLALAGVKF